jgi:hypothetical protein
MLPGTKCAWCNETAVTEVLVQPAQYAAIPGTAEKVVGSNKKVAQRELKQTPIRAPACLEHHQITLNQQPPVKTPRNTTARDVPQMSIYDVPGVDTDANCDR